jgi:Phytanoyl-CoA dioxygenase (PhyH)
VTLFVDPQVQPRHLRQSLYRGDLVVLTNLSSVSEFVDYTREQLADLFKPYDPEHAHQHIDKEEMAKRLGSWKPRFIHSPTSRDLVCKIIREAGFSAVWTHYDVPKPRTSFPVQHLTTGIAYAFPWHRDVWYSAPAQQINWWLPVFALRPDNCMRFDLRNFDRAVPNTSAEFDYYKNNTARLSTVSQVSTERQVRPAAVDYTPVDDLVVVPSPGDVLLFSGAQMHASIPNTSGRARFSVDFRTVDVADLTAGRGAPVVDADCTGTAIRDFLRVEDGAPFDEEAVQKLFGTPPPGSTLVFEAPVVQGLHAS